MAVTGDCRSDLRFGAWAKSQRSVYGELVGWLPLAQHMADSAAVAARLWDRWLPACSRTLLAADVGSLQWARTLMIAMAYLHDIGKATPAFAVKDPELRLRAVASGLPVPAVVPNAHKLPHGLAGFLILQDALQEQAGLSRSQARSLAVVIGGHHGVPPTDEQVAAARGLSEARGAGAWDDARRQLMERAVQALSRIRSEGADLVPGAAAQVVLSGAVIMADWIASSADHFRLFPLHWAPGVGFDPVAAAQDRCDDAWEALQFPDVWAAKGLPGEWDAAFPTRFGLPDGAAPNAVQRAAVDLARSAGGPGVLVIEAPMGVGKTEAALLAAEELAGTCGAGGVLVALPTRATSDAMFARVRRWLSTLVDQSDVPLYLAHGKAGLNEEFQRLARLRLSPVGVDSYASDGADRGMVVAYEWMSGRKRGVLSSFVVGTIDQLLFMGLKARHLALRHLALSGKVVVVDEVHAYDAYMGSYLQVALRWLAAYRVPVVLLSATLAPSVRQSLLDAYAPAPGVPRRGSWRGAEPPQAQPAAGGGYPRLEWRPVDGDPVVRVVDGPTVRDVRVERLASGDAALAELLADRLAGGGCALVIRNTVREVQATAEHLSGVFGADVVAVAHSRFIATDRAAIDRDLVARFGPGGRRPAKAIVVASQVAEQSLDVDFDLLVSDIAPVDLLLQRVGRMHRHPGRTRPPAVAGPVLVLTGVDDWTAPVPQPGAGTRRVYSPWVLLRTLAALDGRARLRVPQDVPALVTQVYDGPPLQGAWADTEAALKSDHDRRQAAKALQAATFQIAGPNASRDLVGWLSAGVGEADETAKGRAQVRDSAETLEVIALQRHPDGSVGLMEWMPQPGVDFAGSLPVEYPADRAAAVCTLALPAHLSTMAAIDELEPLMPASFQDSPWLKGELVLVFGPDGSGRLAGRELRYTRRYGLQEVTDESADT